MEKANESIQEQVNWESYTGLEILTADRAIVGTIEGTTRDPDSDELYFSVEGSAGFEDIIRLPVEFIGVVSKSFLMLDVLVDHFDTLETRSSSARIGPAPRPRRRQRAPREAQFSPALPERRQASPALNGLRSSQFVSDSGIEHLRNHRGSAERAEIAVTHILDDEIPVRLHTLEQRTALLEQFILDFYVRQVIPPERAKDLNEVPTLAADMISVVYGHQDDDSFTANWTQFAERSLAETDVIHLFAKTVYSSLRQQAQMSQDFLATWGICSNGANVLVHLSLGRGESAESWLSHFINLQERGFKAPATVTTDSNPGLIEAVETSWPEATRIRCWAEKLSSVLDEAPASVRPLLKLWLHAIRDAPDRVQGEILAARVIEQFGEDYPQAIQALEDDLPASLAHLDLPIAHRQPIREANLTERTFLDEQLQSLVLSQMRNDDDARKIVFGMLMRASPKMLGIDPGSLDRDQIKAHLNTNGSRAR